MYHSTQKQPSNSNHTFLATAISNSLISNVSWSLFQSIQLAIFPHCEEVFLFHDINQSTSSLRQISAISCHMVEPSAWILYSSMHYRHRCQSSSGCNRSHERNIRDENFLTKTVTDPRLLLISCSENQYEEMQHMARIHDWTIAVGAIAQCLAHSHLESRRILLSCIRFQCLTFYLIS